MNQFRALGLLISTIVVIYTSSSISDLPSEAREIVHGRTLTEKNVVHLLSKNSVESETLTSCEAQLQAKYGCETLGCEDDADGIVNYLGVYYCQFEFIPEWGKGILYVMWTFM